MAMKFILTCSMFELLLKAKADFEDIIDIVELDFHNSNIGLMVWLAKLASLFGYQGNCSSFLVNLIEMCSSTEVAISKYSLGIR